MPKALNYMQDAAASEREICIALLSRWAWATWHRSEKLIWCILFAHVGEIDVTKGKLLQYRQTNLVKVTPSTQGKSVTVSRCLLVQSSPLTVTPSASGHVKTVTVSGLSLKAGKSVVTLFGNMGFTWDLPKLSL